jgi:transcriptional regulator GlxA family with amidase domain
MAKTLGLIIFPLFETLDAYGPIGLIGTRVLKEYYDITLISHIPNEIPLSSSRVPTLAEMDMETAITKTWNVILLPGGIGFEQLLTDNVFLNKLRALNDKCEIMFTVCTGSFTLAAAGVLDGVQATSNKALYCEWTKKFPRVKWVHKARWVHDGKYLSSSGISAGMVWTPVDIYGLIEGCGVVFASNPVLARGCKKLRQSDRIYLERKPRVRSFCGMLL